MREARLFRTGEAPFFYAKGYFLEHTFEKNRELLFVDFRAGYSSNQLCKGENQGGFFGAAGVGINLSVSKKFGSHLLIGYNFYQISPFTDEKGVPQDINGSHLVSIRLGISF